MSDPWRQRCPEGHTSIELGGNSAGYRCTTCNERYAGEPVDAASVDGFPVDRQVYPQASPESVLQQLVDIYRRDERDLIRAREVAPRRPASCISAHLADLRDRGLIRKVSESNRLSFWQPTEAGIESAGGDA